MRHISKTRGSSESKAPKLRLEAKDFEEAQAAKNDEVANDVGVRKPKPPLSNGSVA